MSIALSTFLRGWGHGERARGGYAGRLNGIHIQRPREGSGRDGSDFDVLLPSRRASIRKPCGWWGPTSPREREGSYSRRDGSRHANDSMRRTIPSFAGSRVIDAAIPPILTIALKRSGWPWPPISSNTTPARAIPELVHHPHPERTGPATPRSASAPAPRRRVGAADRQPRSGPDGHLRQGAAAAPGPVRPRRTATTISQTNYRILYDHGIEGKTFAEIAETLGLTTKQVRDRHSRDRQAPRTPREAKMNSRARGAAQSARSDRHLRFRGKTVHDLRFP